MILPQLFAIAVPVDVITKNAIDSLMNKVMNADDLIFSVCEGMGN